MSEVITPHRNFNRRDFGLRIRSLRCERNLSQEDLAKLIFLSSSQLSRVEAGLKKSISIELIEALAVALGTTVLGLLGWK